jgi:hypothetical protein
MKIIYHNGKITSENKSILKALIDLSTNHDDEILVWCHESLKNDLNIEAIPNLFHHDRLMFSYNPSEEYFLGSSIGYVDESPFLKINKDVTYATWQMSGFVGAVQASVLKSFRNDINMQDDFEYFLTSFAKLAMPLGLLCYSEPKLVKAKSSVGIVNHSKTSDVFKFVKQHYKAKWTFLLFFDLMFYENKFPLIPFLASLFYRRKMLARDGWKAIPIPISANIPKNKTIDVIIPTIGRKKYLYDVLTDLKHQAYLPARVIIVEQNPDMESDSELDYLQTEFWPFTIKHFFTNQPGACNARNMAMSEITAEWTFFADDDIRLEPDFIEKALRNIESMQAKAVSINCLQKGEKQSYSTIFQWPYFGSGCSFVKSESLKNCQFSMGYEFGFGEDVDFGMQLRNRGCDILYLPEPTILHLKAPVGGFRSKPILKWQQEQIQPKPSPTVMLYKLLHNTKQQLLGYKTTLLLDYYKHQPVKNPLRYYSNFKKQWNSSVYWANQLRKES